MWPVKTSLFDIILIWLFELIIEKISLEIVSLYLNSYSLGNTQSVIQSVHSGISYDAVVKSEACTDGRHEIDFRISEFLIQG